MLMCSIGKTSCLFSQNLVPNPSFEHTTVYKDQSPNSSLPKDFLWWEPNPASADIYSPRNNTAPRSVRGFQLPAHGTNYLGLAVMYPGMSLYSERVQAKLAEPLEKGRQYVVSFCVSRADLSVGETGKIQLGFSRKKSFERRLFSRFSVRQAVAVPEGQFPPDTAWMLVSGLYVASGKEQFVNLGSFSSRFNKQIRKVTSDTVLTEPGIYYFFDDVNVIALPEDYEDTKADSTQLRSGEWISNLPDPGDSIVFQRMSFAENTAKADDSLELQLDALAAYLEVNPFITGELKLAQQSSLSGKGLQKLLQKRAWELERYFERKGISSNRLHFRWDGTETGRQGVFTVRNVLWK